MSGRKLRRCRQFCGQLWGWRLQRQQDDEPGVAGLGLHPQIAVVLLDDDPAGQIQPEPGALAERLGGEERVEDAADDVLGDARSVVADLDADHLFVLALRAHRQRAVAVHRLDRVVDDVGPHLV